MHKTWHVLTCLLIWAMETPEIWLTFHLMRMSNKNNNMKTRLSKNVNFNDQINSPADKT